MTIRGPFSLVREEMKLRKLLEVKDLKAKHAKVKAQLRNRKPKIGSLTPEEYKIRKQYEDQGFTVLRGGWPDFLAIKDGQVIGVEVKAGSDKLSKAQEAMHKALPFQTVIERF
jgi:hypothetical protein